MKIVLFDDVVFSGRTACLVLVVGVPHFACPETILGGTSCLSTGAICGRRSGMRALVWQGDYPSMNEKEYVPFLESRTQLDTVKFVLNMQSSRSIESVAEQESKATCPISRSVFLIWQGRVDAMATTAKRG